MLCVLGALWTVKVRPALAKLALRAPAEPAALEKATEAEVAAVGDATGNVATRLTEPPVPR